MNYVHYQITCFINPNLAFGAVWKARSQSVYEDNDADKPATMFCHVVWCTNYYECKILEVSWQNFWILHVFFLMQHALIINSSAFKECQFDNSVIIPFHLMRFDFIWRQGLTIADFPDFPCWHADQLWFGVLSLDVGRPLPSVQICAKVMAEKNESNMKEIERTGLVVCL